jgi:hypothetical protein
MRQGVTSFQDAQSTSFQLAVSIPMITAGSTGSLLTTRRCSYPMIAIDATVVRCQYELYTLQPSARLKLAKCPLCYSCCLSFYPSRSNNLEQHSPCAYPRQTTP